MRLVTKTAGSIQAHHLVAGQWLEGADLVEMRNPADPTDLVGHVSTGGAAEVSAAVESARAAQAGWLQLSFARRAEILYSAARLIREHRDELARLESREVGKLISDAEGEVAGTASFLEYHAGDGYRAYGELVASTRDGVRLMTVREPLGVVAVITPWNFPLSSVAKKVGPAILCGNTCVLKPSELAPLSGTRLVQLLLEAGVPEGVVNVVQGGPPVGQALTTHPGVAAITFTGSSRTGRGIAKEATPRGVRVQAEMGGKNALVVLADADVDRAVDMCLAGAFRQEGQMCTATSRAILHRDIHEEFQAKLLSRIDEIRYGDPTDRDNFAGPLVSESQFNKVIGYIERAGQDGAELLAGGHRSTDAERGQGFYVEPTVFAAVKPESALATEEVFGPVLALFSVSDLDEAIAVNNDTNYGLTAAIHTSSMRSAQEFMERAEAGFVSVNLPTTGMELQVPGGGVKSSGWGPKEHGRTGVDFFSEIKSIAMASI
jgi:aldehyde dehydrogenase (NAD+)